jgi:hypothetical protein
VQAYYIIFVFDLLNVLLSWPAIDMDFVCFFFFFINFLYKGIILKKKKKKKNGKVIR